MKVEEIIQTIIKICNEFQAKEVVLQFYQDRLEEEVTSSLRLEVLYLILLVVIEVSPTSDHVTFNHTWAGSLETGVSMHQE